MICPILSRCSAKVSLEHYLNTCSHPTEDNYKKCEHYIALTKVTKSPSEWAEAITGIRVRT